MVIKVKKSQWENGRPSIWNQICLSSRGSSSNYTMLLLCCKWGPTSSNNEKPRGCLWVFEYKRTPHARCLALGVTKGLRAVRSFDPEHPMTVRKDGRWASACCGGCCPCTGRKPRVMSLPVPSNHREGDEEALQHPCRAWDAAVEQIHEQHLRAAEQAGQHCAGCRAVPGSGRRAQACPRRQLHQDVWTDTFLVLSMSASEMVCTFLIGLPLSLRC